MFQNMLFQKSYVLKCKELSQNVQTGLRSFCKHKSTFDQYYCWIWRSSTKLPTCFIENPILPFDLITIHLCVSHTRSLISLLYSSPCCKGPLCAADLTLLPLSSIGDLCVCVCVCVCVCDCVCERERKKEWELLAFGMFWKIKKKW